jgi:RHS repeat-associated protein
VFVSRDALIHLQANRANVKSDLVVPLAFTYAPTTDNGNLTSQTITAPSFSQTQYYGYDGVNRLKAASEGAALTGGGTTCPVTQSWCQEYGYEAFGNRWVSFSNRTLHLATPTSAANFNAATNRLTGSGITYDNAGNLTAHPFLTPGAGGGMVYNASNKMTQFTATGVSVSYRYDAQERRVRQDSGGQTTIWVYDAFGQLAAEYATNLTMPEGVYYRTTDHLGSTRIVTNQSAAVVQRRDFFPFGEAIPADSSHGNRQAVTDGGQVTYNAALGVRQQFTGQQRDEDTGLDYFWARNYPAPTGCFTSMDPKLESAELSDPRSWNRFVYARDNPHAYVDPDGEIVVPVIIWLGLAGDTGGCLVGGGVEIAEQLVDQRLDNGNLENVQIDVGDVLGSAAGGAVAGGLGAITLGQATLTGTGLVVVSSLAGGATGGVAGMVESAVSGEQMDLGDFLLEVGEGMITGPLGHFRLIRAVPGLGRSRVGRGRIGRMVGRRQRTTSLRACTLQERRHAQNVAKRQAIDALVGEVNLGALVPAADTMIRIPIEFLDLDGNGAPPMPEPEDPTPRMEEF